MKPQSGNVLFLILIAVALFAALSYVISSSTRSGSGDTGREKMRMEVSRMMGYGMSVRATVQRMILSGTPSDKIVLHPPGAGYTTCSTEPFCAFSPQYGGAIADRDGDIIPQIDLNGNRWDYYEIGDAQTVQFGTASPDLWIRRDMASNDTSRRMCEEINKAMGLTATIININSLPPVFPGGCVDTTGGQYWFVFALTEN